MKTIDITVPVYSLLESYPDLKDVLVQAGFDKLTDPAMLNTLGRIISLEKGASMKGIDLQDLEARLNAAGYSMHPENNPLQPYIERLNQGEDLEQVRKDFADEFEHVSVAEIMDAEQALLDAGMEAEKMQGLCDLHSALFHGKTEAEVIAMEQGTNTWYMIDLLEKENRALEKRMENLKALLAAPAPDYAAVKAALQDLKLLKKHYQKKEELIMPFLYDAGITGPSVVMWGVDDEILKDLSQLERGLTSDNLKASAPAILSLLGRMEEMVYKEEKILFPLAKEHLSKEDWLKTYKDIWEYGLAWIDEPAKWQEGEVWAAANQWVPEDMEVELPTGRMSLQQMKTLFDTLPIDITYIDENDNLIFFTNEGKVFARPLSALNRNVLGCHPPRIVPIVEKMLSQFKAKEKDRVERWLPNPDKPVKVVYQAIYDKNGDYKGTIEMVQSFEKEKDILARFAQPKNKEA